jgi:valyl-tRNA synthetase
MEKVTRKVTTAYENCQFNIAAEETRNFAWHELCDIYIEAAKHRLYKPEEYGEKRKRAAQYTLYTAIYRSLQLLAPISPHITEEIYQFMYAEDKKYESIHVSPWPTAAKERIDEEAERKGDLIIAVIGEVRREKAERKTPLNAPIKKLTLYGGSKKNEQILNQALEDIAGTCKIEKIEISPAEGKGREVKGYPNIRFRAEY